MKIAAVVGIVAGAFVILGVTFGLGVLAGSQCGGHHGEHGGPGEHGRHMMFDRGGQPPMLPPGGPLIIERGPAFIPPQPSERQDRRDQPQPPTPSTTAAPRP